MGVFCIAFALGPLANALVLLGAVALCYVAHRIYDLRKRVAARDPTVTIAYVRAVLLPAAVATGLLLLAGYAAVGIAA